MKQVQEKISRATICQLKQGKNKLNHLLRLVGQNLQSRKKILIRVKLPIRKVWNNLSSGLVIEIVEN